MKKIIQQVVKVYDFLKPYRKILILLTILLFYSVFLYQCGRKSVTSNETKSVEVKHDTITMTSVDHNHLFVSTKPLYIYKVKKVESTSTDTIYKDNVQIVHDSISIPIKQNVYKGTNYTAYVSGFNQSLDSISVTSNIITNTITKYKSKRWNIGVSAGYACTSNGFQPYVGIGIVYNIFK